MKRILLILLLLQSLPLAAQIGISDFKAAPEVQSPDAIRDPDGNPCAALQIRTSFDGWTFDAGLSGIMDTRIEEGTIWLYVPADARKLTVAHPKYGVLRDWSFPVTLSGGQTYTMTLGYDAPKPTPKPAPVPVQRTAPGQVPAPVPLRTVQDSRHFSDHFLDMYAGFVFDRNEDGSYGSESYCVGLNYTWVGRRIGPYVSANLDLDESYSLLAGVALRLSHPDTAAMDWQIYGGAGMMDGQLAFDAGMRFGWRSRQRLSKLDFSIGCQFSEGILMPTIGVGFYIWGVPVAVGVGLIAASI